MDDGAVVLLTGRHPVLTTVGWIDAGTLSAGHRVETMHGTAGVRSIEIMRGTSRVYDLTVEPFGTFIANGIVVHNKSVPLPPTVEEVSGVWAGFDELGNGFARLQLNPDGTGEITLFRSWNPEGRSRGGYVWSIDHYKQPQSLSGSTFHWVLDSRTARGRFDTVPSVDWWFATWVGDPRGSALEIVLHEAGRPAAHKYATTYHLTRPDRYEQLLDLAESRRAPGRPE
jgi:hypothetical protein